MGREELGDDVVAIERDLAGLVERLKVSASIRAVSYTTEDKVPSRGAFRDLSWSLKRSYTQQRVMDAMMRPYASALLRHLHASRANINSTS